MSWKTVCILRKRQKTGRFVWRTLNLNLILLENDLLMTTEFSENEVVEESKQIFDLETKKANNVIF